MSMLHRALEIAKTEGVSALSRYVLMKFDQETGLLSFLLVPYASKTFRSIKNWTDALDFVFSNNLVALLIRPMQVREEIAQLLEIISGLRPRVILEIGTARGGTLFLWTRVAAEDALLISVDLPGGPFGGGYSRLRGVLYKRFACCSQRIELIRANSHSPDTLEKVKKLLNGRYVDFLFIDGDHTYNGVKTDYEMYSELVRPGGIIAFHDIVEHPQHPDVGVPRFWQELKKSLPLDRNYIEIVKDWKQGWAGIGVIFKR